MWIFFILCVIVLLFLERKTLFKSFYRENEHDPTYIQPRHIDIGMMKAEIAALTREHQGSESVFSKQNVTNIEPEIPEREPTPIELELAKLIEEESNKL